MDNCMQAYRCIYIYIPSLSLSLLLSIYIYGYLYLYVSFYVSFYASLYVYIYIYPCACMCLYIFTYALWSFSLLMGIPLSLGMATKIAANEEATYSCRKYPPDMNRFFKS